MHYSRQNFLENFRKEENLPIMNNRADHTLNNVHQNESSAEALDPKYDGQAS